MKKLVMLACVLSMLTASMMLYLVIQTKYKINSNQTPAATVVKDEEREKRKINWDQTPAATVVKDEEHVLITTDGEMYVSKNAHQQEKFILLYEVRFPFKMEIMLIPLNRIDKLYMKGLRTKE